MRMRSTARSVEDADGRLLDPTSPQWPDMLRRVRHDVYHLPDYAVIEAARTPGAVARAFAYCESGRFALLPLVLRPTPLSPHRTDAASPYGYGGPVTNTPNDDEFTRRMLASLRAVLLEARVVTLFVRFHPLLVGPRGPYSEWGTVLQHGETVSIDLSQSLDRMWSETRRGHRNQINRARRSGLQVIFDDWSQLDAWVLAYRENMRAMGASRRYLFKDDYFVALRKRLRDNVHLTTAVGPDGSFVSGMILFERCAIVQAHLAATWWEHPLGTHAGKLLDDETRRWAKDQGASVYHLGGGFGGEQDSLFDYKAGFSDRRHPFATWRLVVDPSAYEDLLTRTGASGCSRFFPAYRRDDA